MLHQCPGVPLGGAGRAGGRKNDKEGDAPELATSSGFGKGCCVPSPLSKIRLFLAIREDQSESE